MLYFTDEDILSFDYKIVFKIIHTINFFPEANYQNPLVYSDITRFFVSFFFYFPNFFLKRHKSSQWVGSFSKLSF